MGWGIRFTSQVFIDLCALCDIERRLADNRRSVRNEVSASLQEDLASHLRISEEMACDDLVLESTHPEVHQYANSLLNGAELLSLSAIRPSVVASGINSGGNLGKRLKMMITEIPWKVSASLRLGIVAMAFCILPLGLVYAQDFKAVERRLGGAVETGELTLKQASIMMDALKRSAGFEHAHVRKMGAKKRRYMAFAKEIKAAVDAGKISKEEAKKKLFELRKKMFRNAGQNKEDWSDKGEDRAMGDKERSHREKNKNSSHWRGHGKGSRGKSHWGHILSFVMGIDKDHDWIIDDKEFDVAFVNLEELMKKHKEHFFKRIDTDGDGALSMGERNTMHKKWGERMKHSRPQWHIWGKTWMPRHGEKSDKDKEAMKGKIHGWISRMARMRNAFVIKRFDVNNDGKLIGNEMTTAREEIRHFRNDFKHFGEIMKKVDKNDDLVIDEKELDAAMADHKARRERKKKEIVVKYDKDNDGKLNGDERKASHIAGKDRWESKRKAMQDYWANRLDVNKDGKIFSKEIGDFWDARKDSFKKILKTMAAMRNDYLAKKYDSTKDGSLSKDERGKAMSRWREKMKSHWQKYSKIQDDD